MIRTVARVAAGALVLIFLALGIWQLDRRAWKLALIEQVERNMIAPPAAPPPAGDPFDPALAYRRVAADGRYLAGQDRLVQAVTELGGGYWVMTPLETAGGRILVNRGFVPREAREAVATPPAGTVRVTGLLRESEPGGGFLRTNDPAADRWYSRDVAAIAESAGVAPVAPYFIDADAGAAGWPRGGMTVVRFRNTHLVYALTWFGMAGLLAFLIWRVSRPGRRAA